MFNFNNQYSTNHRKKSKNSVNFSRSNANTGNIGENYVKQLLWDSGYFAKKRRKKRFAGDLWTKSTQTHPTLNIEVKTANESQFGTYHFCLRKDGHTDICYSDYVILVCIDRFGSKFCYCIPCSYLVTANISVTSHPLRYKGKFAKFRVHGSIDFARTDEIAWTL